LSLAYQQTFDFPSDPYEGLYGDVGGLVDVNNDFKMAFTQPGQRVELMLPTFADVVAQADVTLITGSFSLSVRQYETQAYTATLDGAGLLTLYRNQATVSSAIVGVSPAARNLRMSAIGNLVSVSLDNTLILTFADDTPLSTGLIVLQTGGTAIEILIDNLQVWIVSPETAMALSAASAPSSVTYSSLLTGNNAFIFSGSGAFWYQYAKNTATGDIHVISAHDEPNVSPDGMWIAYGCRGSTPAYICVVRTNGTGHMVVASLQTGMCSGTCTGTQYFRSPEWSPDGTKIAFIHYNSYRNTYGLYVLDINLTAGTFSTARSLGACTGRPKWIGDTIYCTNSSGEASGIVAFNTTAGTRVLYPFAATTLNAAYVLRADFIQAGGDVVAVFETRVFNIPGNQTETHPGLGFLTLHGDGTTEQSLLSYGANTAIGRPFWIGNGTQLVAYFSDYDIPSESGEYVINRVTQERQRFVKPDGIVSSVRSWEPVFIQTAAGTPTATPTSLPPTCVAYVNAEPDFAFRSEPSLSSVTISRLTDNTPLVVLGEYIGEGTEYYSWYRVEHNETVGWMRSDGIAIDEECEDLAIIDLATGMPIYALYDYVLDETPPQNWSDLPCSDLELPRDQQLANWTNCARVVYSRFYQRFFQITNRYPRMSDVLAAVYANELGDVAFPENVPSGINSRLNVPIGSIRSEAIAANYWSVVYQYGDNGRSLTIEDLTQLYLVQVQSWYQTANVDPSSVDEDLIRGAIEYRNVAWRVLSQEWVVNENSVRHWGNIPFGINTGYNNLYLNPQVAYCYTAREFEDRDGDLLTVIRQTDYWTDYRFVFILGTGLGEGYVIDTYNQNDDPLPPAPEWLVQVNNDGSTYYRNTVDSQPNDGIVGRVFLDCSANVASVPGI
jgi:hypothetical protein